MQARRLIAASLAVAALTLACSRDEPRARGEEGDHRPRSRSSAASATASASASAPRSEIMARAAWPLTKANTDSITDLVIDHGDEEVALQKVADGWQLTAPLHTKADATAVEQALENLRKLEPAEVISDETTAYAEYELDDAHALHIRAYRGDTLILDAYFGKSGSRGQSMREGGSGAKRGVVSVKGYSSFLWARSAKNWRHARVVDLGPESVAVVEIDNAAGKLRFERKGDAWSGTSDGKPIDHFDEGRVADLLRAYTSLRAVDFAGDEDDTGIADAERAGGVIRFFPAGASRPSHELRIGRKQRGNDRYVGHKGDATVYVITSFSADWATATAERFQR